MHFLSMLLVAVFFNLSNEIHWAEDLEEAKAIAKKEQKLILLVFSGSDWCRNCILLDQEVFKTDDFQVLAQKHLVLLKADFPRKRKNQLPEPQQAINNDLARRFNAEGAFPKVVMMDDQETIVLETNYQQGQKQHFLEQIKVHIQHE